MKFSSNKIIKLIKKNIEIILLFLLLAITITSTTIYNNKKILINENYKDVINNIYFQKSVKQIFDNLTPRYKSIEHKISSGETFDKILNNYSISNEEILEIKKNLNNCLDNKCYNKTYIAWVIKRPQKLIVFNQIETLDSLLLSNEKASILSF